MSNSKNGSAENLIFETISTSSNPCPAGCNSCEIVYSKPIVVIGNEVIIEINSTTQTELE